MLLFTVVDARPPARLDVLDERTETRRSRAVADFSDFLRDGQLPPLDILRDGQLGLVLVEYIQYLYNNDKPVSHGKELLNHLVRRNRELRPFLRDAWRSITEWDTLEPGTSRHPMPEGVLLASVVVAMIWARYNFVWMRIAVALVVGFSAALRPADVYFLTREGFVLPCDAFSEVREVWLVLRHSKTKKMTRLQHACISDPILVDFIESFWYLAAPPGEGGKRAPLLIEGDARTRADFFRTRFDVLMRFLGVPTSQKEGLTPSSLRAGGITALYRRNKDLHLLRLVGRWSNMRTMETYIQELPAVMIMTHLSEASKRRILSLSKFGGILVRDFAVSRRL